MSEIKIVNVSTGKETVRQMNQQELAQAELDKQNLEAKLKIKAEAKALAEAKLSSLGLTADDLKALLG